MALAALPIVVIVHGESAKQYDRDRWILQLAFAIFVVFLLWFLLIPLQQRLSDHRHGRRRPLARHRRLDDGSVELKLLPRDEPVGDVLVRVWSHTSPLYSRLVSPPAITTFPQGFGDARDSAQQGRYHFVFVKLSTFGGVMSEQGELARGRFRFRPKASGANRTLSP